ncbi:MAG: response regulator [Desulfobulbaceae bacterium]|nr:response regulator [Desulfobulbaceae bacterium]
MFDVKAKILLVDDRPENLHAMRITLKPLEDVEIYTAQSGNEGLALMTEHDFAVVLMDVQMPEMDGFETAALMQNLKTTRNIPIIFVTAISKDEEHVFKGYQAGAVDYLFKPLNHDILMSKVKVFLKLYRQRIECEWMQAEIQKNKNIEALGVLAGGIAHDFNNLLTTIFGYIELAQLLSGKESKIYQKLAEAIKAAKRARLLTQQLLTFSKGGGPVKERADIADLLADTSSLLLSGSNVKVHLDIADGLGEVEVDKGQINQVFQNLLLNAKDAMVNGGNLTITARNVTIDGNSQEPMVADGKYVQVTFRDDGPGIDPAIIGRIFDPYFSSKAKGASGQGLGLTISHSIVKKHGGYIRAESTPGHGATFQVFLPRVTGPRGERLAAGEQEGGGAVAGPAALDLKESKRLLVMEDEESVATALCELLGYLGYRAEVAGDGCKALSMFQAAVERGEPYDGVILDLTIRGGEGGEKVLAKLRAVDSRIKALVASGYAENHIMSNYQEYGFDGAIGKPFTLNSLAREVKNLF